MPSLGVRNFGCPIAGSIRMYRALRDSVLGLRLGMTEGKVLSFQHAFSWNPALNHRSGFSANAWKNITGGCISVARYSSLMS